MSVETFDDFNSTDRARTEGNEKPFQFRDKQSSKKDTLEWLNKNFDSIEKAALSRFITYRRHHALYKGIHWRFNDLKNSDRDIEYSERKPRHTVNFVKESLDIKVAQMARFKTNFALIPAHDEQTDISNAKGCKLLLDARAEELGMDSIHSEADTIKYNYGIVFQLVLWDENIGPLHPSYQRLTEAFGDQMPAEYRRKLKKQGPIHVGDVDVANYGPDRIFPELDKKRWKDVDHFDFTDWVNIHQLKKDYPKVASEIMENKREHFDFENMEVSVPDNLVQVRYFYHKRTKYLPGGAFIKYTDDVILEWTDYPYNEERLPMVWDGDHVIYGELWPRSYISQIEQMQRYYNNIQSAQARDSGQGSAPKWVAPKGSTEISAFSNEFVIMQYKGAIAPKLIQNNPISEQSFTVQDRLEKKIFKHSKIFDITRGDVPQGVTANSALRFLDEQESHTNMTDETKRKLRVIAVYRMMLTRMAQFYKASDGRTVRTLGKNNEYLIRGLKKADFSKVYDIRMQNQSALPDTKTGRISTIVDLNIATQTDPVFTKQEIIKMLDFGLDDAFKDEATVAVDSAKQTLEMLLDGEEAPEPQPWDNFLVHYSIFSKAIQTVAFKLKTSPEIKKSVLEHVMTMENLMYERAMKNMTFLQHLTMLDNYPMIFTLPQPLSALMPAPPAEENGADTTKMKPKDNTGEKK